MAQKRVSDAFLVNIGQLDHYVVFGTKSGHFKPSDDLFRGQKAVFGTALGPKRA